MARELSLQELRQKYGDLVKAFARRDAFDQWQLVVDISGHLEGYFEDWPAHIQDPIWQSMERFCKPKPGEHVKIVAGRCYNDGVGEPSHLVVVAQAFPNFEM